MTTLARSLGLAVSLVYAAATAFDAEWAHKFISHLASIAVILVLVFDWWAWEWGWVRALIGRPLLKGTWAVTLQPHSDSHIPAGGNRGPIRGYICIEQSGFAVHVTQYTAESTSHSTGCKIIPNGESKERRTLSFLYRNEAKREHQHRSPSHAGACELYMAGLAPIELEGMYWTGRLTAGDMKLQLVDRETSCGSFAELEEKFGSKL